MCRTGKITDKEYNILMAIMSGVGTSGFNVPINTHANWHTSI